MIDVKDLAKQIEALSPPDRLRMAADLMDVQRGDVAYVVAKPVIDELGAALTIQRLRRRR